ncbi:hypothetical protein DFJ63DRAFT_337064 [Scheffersomyces coipomensis]|uniref:uncharacterized protein n=1 Tax=Scheffersomyces coipomensis TaxID=1788519 RepID=UPI00315DC552
MVAKTRSTSTKKTITSTSLEVDDKKVVKKVTKVTKKKTSTKSSAPESPSKKKKEKVIIEDYLATKIPIPIDLKLPEKFVEYHTPEFVTGVNYIIKQDNALYPVIVHSNFPRFAKDNIIHSGEPHGYWYALIASVISQQISGSAAKSIENKFKNLFEELGEDLIPVNVLTKSDEQLRKVGFSFQKIKYVRHISETFNNPDENLCNAKFYKEQPLDVVIEELVKLKGIGFWSAKMFAIFTLGEMDIFAHDDLGVARGMSKYLARRPDLYSSIKKEVDADEDLKDLLKKKSLFANKKTDSKRDWNPYHDVYVKHAAERFSPYRSVLMLVMWRLSATNVEVLEWNL